MLNFWFWVYNLIALPLLWLGFRFLSLFNSKIREGFKGRRNIFKEIRKWKFEEGKPVVIIHSSSLGEYQQAIPLIIELNSLGYGIITTFFSPSGFRNSKTLFSNVKKSYLPFDSYPCVKRFLDTVNPDMVILMRYDLWFNFMFYSRKKGIKIVMANARYDEKDIVWKIPFVSSFKKSMYRMIDKMFAIDDADFINYKKMLEGTSVQIFKAGDSKFERVYEASKNFSKEELLGKKITDGKKVFVVGSSWKDDEDVILPVIDKFAEKGFNILTVLVPHEPKETKISAIEKNILNRYPGLSAIRFSEITGYSGQNVIIVDSIGLLMKLYSEAYIAYVGGGFRTGLHNVLEPAVFNIPVFFANEVKNSDEDELLVENKCGIVVRNMKQFYREFKLVLTNEGYYNTAANGCKSVFRDTLGTTEKIIKNIT
jgi:3-deoxy-D-manno-octulosonic-acid transferase